VRRHATKTGSPGGVRVGDVADVISIRVRLFASLADAAGARALDVQVPAALPVGGIWTYLPDPVHRGAPPPDGMRWAVNGEWAAPGVPLGDGDEVGVITPVSGG
jgi:MoaE-MoaD fusion protein